jgi:DNA mismatch repair protein MutS2
MNSGDVPAEAFANERAFADLEWPSLLERVSRHCLSEPAVAFVRELTPAASIAEARARLARTREALALLERGTLIPAEAMDDPSEVLLRTGRGGIASASELASLTRLLRAARGLRSFVAAHPEAPALGEVLTTARELDSLLSTLEDAIESDGSISDRASDALRTARRRASDARRELLQRLGQLLSRYSEVLRDRYYAERDGRYVLPVRSDAHLRVPGIVLGASASGGTLYVEPQEITSLGNRLAVLLAEVEREEARVLAELSGKVRALLPDVERARDAVVAADVAAAIVRWAGEARAHAVDLLEEPILELQSMRHPLLVGVVEEVIPNDVAVAGGRALVVSGPNAGGKTVALKCLGLACLMVASGLPLPADPSSRVGWFEVVVTDVGDDQSLVRSLSTFSAHIDNLARIIHAAGPRTLVLLDELAGGTDPEEGAALAIAVLEGLVERGAAVAVTTHYERLKEVGAEDPRFVNASVGFDMARLAPTFHLTLGVPGPSSALAVAARFGIPATVVQRARELVPKEATDREELIRSLEIERDALRRARATAEAEALRQSELTRSMERERERLEERERARLVREAEHLMVAVRQARERLRAVEKRMESAQAGAGQLGALHREIDLAAHPIAVGTELAQLMRPPAGTGVRAEALELQPGTRVYLRKLGKPAEVVESPVRGQVRVMAGPLKLLVSVDEVELAAGTKPAPPTRSATHSPARKKQQAGLQTVNALVPVRTSSNTLDLRGQRQDDALSLLDAFLDRALSTGEPAVFVLHGHGTGRLKQAVRDHLKGSTYVDRSEAAGSEDGGDAFTLAWLRT